MILSEEIEKYQKEHKKYYLQDFYKDLVRRGVIKSYTQGEGHFFCSGAMKPCMTGKSNSEKDS